MGFKEGFLFPVSVECLGANEKGLRKGEVLETKVVEGLGCPAGGGRGARYRWGLLGSKWPLSCLDWKEGNRQAASGWAM